MGIVSKVEFNFLYFMDFFNNYYNIRIIYISFFQSFLSSFFSCLIAIPLSLSLNRQKKFIISKIIISLCGYAFVMPTILIVHSIIGIYGVNGSINSFYDFYNLFNIKSLFGLKAIIFAHILLNTPFATRLFYQNLNSIPNNYIEISNSINLGFWGHLCKIEWPILKQNIFSIFSIIFVLCFLSFAIVMTLGGGPRTSTLEVAIYQSIFFELNFNKAIILSILQIIICLALLIFGFYTLKGLNFFEIQKINYKHPFKNIFGIKIFDIIVIFIFSTILFSPIYYILINFFENVIFKDYLIQNYFLNALKNSIIIAIITGICVTTMGLAISFLLVNSIKNFFLQHLLFIISSIVLIISPVIISLGYFIILGELRYIPIIIYIVVIAINCIFLLPFAILILFNNLKNIFLNFDDIKKTFRINDINFLNLIFPLIKKNILFVFSFSTAISFGDFTIISFFKNDNFQTLTTLLYKLVSSYRFNEATFVAGFILILSLLIYLIFDNNFYKDKPVNSKCT